MGVFSISSKAVNLCSNYVSRITEALPSLSAAERPIAQFILSNSLACSNMSIRTLADLSGSSTSSVHRLCKHLGYSGFPELKFQIRQSGAVPQTNDLVINSYDSVDTNKQKVAQFAQYCINSTMTSLDNDLLAKASAALANAHRVLLCAVGSASGAALASANHLLSMGIFALFLSEELLQLRATTFFHQGDVVIGLCYEGASKSVADVFLIAQKQGATTILITAFSDHAVAQYADIVLRVPKHNDENSLNFPATTISQMFTIQLLMIGAWQRVGRQLTQKSRKARAYSKIKHHNNKTNIQEEPT